MVSNKTFKLVLTALMAALTCIATKIITFPSPIGGYIHLGDGFVFLSGVFLGPIYGGAAAGIGSMYADILAGYGSYAPATFIIKALAAATTGILYKKLSFKKSKSSIMKYTLPMIISGIAGGVIVVIGYFIFEAKFMSLGLSAAANIPANIVQISFGVIISTVLIKVLGETVLKSLLSNNNYN